MANSDLLMFHSESLRDYATFWFDPEVRQESEVSEEEAGHHLCEHAAMLFRYTGQEVCLTGLTEQPPEWRRSLVLAVCRYLAGLTLADAARRLLSDAAIDADQLTEIEDLVIERDAIEEVLTLAVRLAADLVRDGDSDLRRELAMARSIVAELDDVLWDRPDVLSVACRALDGLRAQLAVRPDERAQWWFGKAVSLDDSFEKGSIMELLSIRQTPARPAPLVGVISFSASLFGREEVPVRLAAADASSGPSAASLNAHIPELPELRILVTRLSPDSYQFVFIDDHSGERSTRLDDHRLVAGMGNGDQVVSSITSGIAMLRTPVSFDGCRLETADGQLVGTLVLDTTNG